MAPRRKCASTSSRSRGAINLITKEKCDESEDGGDVIATYHHANKAYLDLDGLDVLATKVQKKIAYGTEDLTPGVSELAEGTFYFYYE